MADSRISTPPEVFSPKKIELDKNLVNEQNDDQNYMEEISVEQLAAAPQPMTYSAYDSAEGIAPDSDLDDEQIRRMLASPLKIREGEENK